MKKNHMKPITPADISDASAEIGARTQATPPNTIRRSLLAAAPAMLFFGAARAQSAKAYPNRPVTLLIPYSAGTAADAVARHISVRLTKLWGVSVIVENKSGADGLVGTQAVQHAPSDGYTVLFTGPPFLFSTELLDTAPYSPLQDFTPVARISSAMWMLAASKDAPFNNVRELIEVAQKSPNGIDIAIAGSASLALITALKDATGIRFNAVPYTRVSQAITDTAAGHVPLVVASISGTTPLVNAGKLKIL